MDVLNTISGLLGLVLGIFSTYITYVTFLNPMRRFRKYLKHSEKWENIFTDTFGTDSYYRYGGHPEFIIKRDTRDNSKDWNVNEDWMPSCPDPKKSSTMVHLIVNGQILIAEEFIFMDGARYFVPVPRRKLVDKDAGKFEYWYTDIQVNIARIISSFYRKETVEDFMKESKIIFRNENMTVLERIKFRLYKWKDT